jgi:hypothetical protein
MALAHRRGGGLRWNTRDTGAVWCSPSYSVHFGTNNLGLVTAYAKDITMLPEWQQRIWAGFNISPDGGVSEELFSAQAKGIPADTQAPEAGLPKAIEELKRAGREKLGFVLFREHEQFNTVLARTHRLRATDRAGFFALAKDLARLTADTLDGSALQTIVAPPKGVKWGSLKALENLLARKIGAEEARRLMGPLFGTYDLRLADAHLTSNEVEEAFTLVGVDQALPYVTQGCQLLRTCVTCLEEVLRILQQFTPEEIAAQHRAK